MESKSSRRRILFGAAGVSSFFLTSRKGRTSAKPKMDEENVSATEDLMREHGILRRLLLVYGETIHRVEANQAVSIESVAQSAQIVRSFIEDYHEKDEEEYIFPHFKKAGKLANLVDVLLQQHQAGRKLTAEIQRLATRTSLSSESNRKQMAHVMRQFVRMYEPHSAREDTVLFPAFATLMSEKELHKLQDTFEQKEKALPMGDLETMVADVTKIEQSLGIYDLAQFTPKP